MGHQNCRQLGLMIKSCKPFFQRTGKTTQELHHPLALGFLGDFMAMKRLHVGKIQDQAESLGLSETMIYSNGFAI